MNTDDLAGNLRLVLNRLGGVRPTQDGWDALCPVPNHNRDGDQSPSLRVARGDDGRVLLKCRVGCKTDAVLEALDLEWSDLSAGGGEGADGEPPPADSARATRPAKADPDLCSRAYTALLAELPLSDDHREGLRGRGLDDAQIDTRGYKTLRHTERGRAAAAVHGLAGDAVFDVPGFVRGTYGTTLQGDATGLLVPVRDLDGRIAAVKIRRERSPKYIYVSSSGDGPSPGSPVHVPLGVVAPAPVVRVTEGELKADVCAALDDVPTVGVPGVTQWKAALPILKALGAKTVVLAYDAPDVRSKAPVFEQAEALYLALLGEGYAVELEDWAGPSKGIDDLLAAGSRPKNLVGPEVKAFFAGVRGSLFGSPDPISSAVAGLRGADVRPAFPVEVFPSEVANFARRVSAAMGCPLDFPGLAILVVGGAAVGAARSLQVKGGWYEKPGMYAVIVSRPGTTKTPALRAVMSPIYERQDQLYAEYRAAKIAYEEAAEAYGRDAGPDAGGEPGSGPPAEPAPLRHLFANDTTVEELANNLKENPKGILLFRDELTAWVRSLDMYRGKGTDRQFFLSGWSGEMVKVDRKGQHGNPIIIPHPFVSVLGGIQPDLLTELQAEAGCEDGFSHRVLFSFPAETPVKGWLDDEVSDEDQEGWRRIVDRLLNLRPLEVGGESPRPRSLAFAPEARLAFVEWYDRQAADMNDEDFPRELTGPCSKLRSYCPRFALVIHLLRVACGEAGTEQDEGAIDAEDVARAVSLCDYFTAHSRAVYLRLRQSREDEEVDEFLRWMARKGLTDCKTRDVCRANVCGIKKASDAERLMKAAADRGKGEWQAGAASKKNSRADSSAFVLKGGQ